MLIFPVFFVIGIGYYLGKKNPKIDTNFITNFAGNIGTPAMIFYTVTTTGITLSVFMHYFIYALIMICGFTILGLIVFFLFTYIPISNIVSLSNVLMISSTLLLFGVLFTEESLGARRRYDLGIFDFQPSEFTKVIFVIFLANALSKRKNNFFTISLVITNLLLLYIQQHQRLRQYF